MYRTVNSNEFTHLFRVGLPSIVLDNNREERVEHAESVGGVCTRNELEHVEDPATEVGHQQQGDRSGVGSRELLLLTLNLVQ